MFQYVFTRMTARRLGVKFFFPEWIGDKIFLLHDEDERSNNGLDVYRKYEEPRSNCGFNEEALTITDGTDIYGCFLSEKYFLDRNLVRDWFSLEDEAVISVKDKYHHINFSRSVSLHFRFGDKLRSHQDKYIIPGLSYYTEALSWVNNYEHLLIFSDEIEIAKKTAEKLSGHIIYMDGNKDYEDLYLMSLCHDNMCSSSTLSWWGAWLNIHSDKVVVCLKEWTRPGYVEHRNLTCDGWREIRTVNSILGHYYVVSFLRLISRMIEALSRGIKD
jgi:hypothetical protein